IALTKNNNKCILTLALSYGSRREIIDATKSIAKQVIAGKLNIDDIDENLFGNSLYTAGMPDPDLMIRTSGEQRISNYLLYQMAYTEFCFLKKMWRSEEHTSELQSR